MTMMSYGYLGLVKIVEDILALDDEVRFVDWLRDLPADLCMINSLVNECVEAGASNCLIALVKGEVSYMRPTFDAAKLSDSVVNPLAYIAHSCPEESYVIELMLTKCRGTGTCLANVYCTIGAVHGLPIHFLLINLSVLEHLYMWYQGGSLIKLVVLLCLWETKPILDSLRVFVEYTDSINGIAWTVLKNGGLKQFAALLLIAPKKVKAPLDTGLTIHDYIKCELDSFSDGKLSIEQEEYKCILTDAQTLLALFEATCDDLSSYCSSVQKRLSADDTVDDVIGLLAKHEVGFCGSDYILSDCCRKGYFARVLSDSDPSPLYPGYSPKFMTRAAWPSYYSGKVCHLNDYRLRWRAPLAIPKSLHGRFYSTRACQAKKMSKPLPYTTSGSLVPIAAKLINRVRFL